MTDDSRTNPYPRMAAGNWWKLRERFQKTMPRAKVDGDFISTILGSDGNSMSVDSARKNVLRPLQVMGLVKEDGLIDDELVGLWRTDEDYAEACRIIRERIYPSSLLDALPPPSPDGNEASKWFMRNAKVGEGAAKQMVDTYVLLVTADASVATRSKPKSTKLPANKKAPTKPATPVAHTTDHSDSVSDKTSPKEHQSIAPTLHIDVQIHISPESTDAQIEAIFANMAKYLYGSNNHET